MTRAALPIPSRRQALSLMAVLGLTACDRKDAQRPAAGSAMTLEAAVAGDWRSPADRDRDRWRHPVEALTFWGLDPGDTVVEFWPGAGWYSDIIAPYLAANGGRLYAANLEPADDAARQTVEAYRRRFLVDRKLYGTVEITSFGPGPAEPAPASGADLVLFLRNIHNWMAAGIVEKAFADAFTALRSGGVLGIEEHRADPAGMPDPTAASGYVPQAYVIQLAQEAGFVGLQTSEINANPLDHRDHPFGVWTLPPTRLSAPRGQPADPTFDHGPYDAIGESDRMTLRFTKP